MYGIALTVAACLRAGTRADVAWLIDADGIEVADWSEAVVFTPGGGRIGSILGGALDGQLAERVGRLDAGRLLDLEISQTDALIAGLASAGSARCLLLPALAFPSDVWDVAIRRHPICLVCRVEGDVVVEVGSYTADTIDRAGEGVAQLFAGGVGSTIVDDLVVSVFRAVPQLVIIGDTPVATALAGLAGVIGWQARVVTDASSATGRMAGLSTFDKVVVAAHDLELAGTALLAALDSEAGYIGALGSRKMQENRADWLAYRGVTDLSRIHGPAGLAIGAATPGEIAVSILAEAIAEGTGLEGTGMAPAMESSRGVG